jgi:hypothetical protein
MLTLSFDVTKTNTKKVFVITWVDADGWFGEITLVNKNEKISLYTETLGKEKAKALFNQLIDEADLVE